MRYAVILALVIATLTAPLTHASRATLSSAPDSLSEVHLVFVGDLMVGRYVGAALRARGYDAPFGDVKSFLQSADLAIGNLEGPVVAPGTRSIPAPSPNELNLTGDIRSVPALSRAGFDLLSVANNHSLDAGQDGLKSTLAALRANNIGALGTTDVRGGQTAVIREVRGLRIAFLAYTAIRPNNLSEAAMRNSALPVGIAYVNPVNASDKARFTREIGMARSQADALVVIIHWGTEYAGQPDAGQLELSRLASEAGANLVVGAHPHVAQGLVLAPHGAPNQSTVVAYSLGNALFDQMTNAQTRQGLALDCFLDRAGVKSARLIPMEIQTNANYSMRVVDDAYGQPTLARASLSTPSTLRWRALWDASQSAPGIALAYKQDDALANRESLENLGLPGPTRVQLQDGTLAVKELQTGGAWRTVWASDPDWRVTGYTVGDANADGKPELVYSLWKKRLTWERPAEGGLRVNMQGGDILPHIYINGWRDGALRPVWHGSPRPAPALALAVPRISKSGAPLLAVLESSNAGIAQSSGTIKLWEWTGGFGYELAQAIPGDYSRMWTDGKMLLFR